MKIIMIKAIKTVKILTAWLIAIINTKNTKTFN